MGSEVLGYDDALSADHNYGPDVQIFLDETDFSDVARPIIDALDHELPDTFEGWPVRFPARTRPPHAVERQGMLWSEHGVEFYTLSAWCKRFLQGPFDQPLSWRDWLSCPEHFFLLVTAGQVFRDDTGALSRLRQYFDGFPRDVWLYKLSVQWGRIAEERAHVGRAGSVGDEIGSRVIAARMVEHLMRLAMLLERRFCPYSKWLGTAFRELGCASALSPLLDKVLKAGCWQEREVCLYDACAFLANLQLEKDVPGALPPTPGDLHGRPFRFVDTQQISDGIRDAIDSEEIRNLHGLGGADQFLSGHFVQAVPQLTRAAFAALSQEIDTLFRR